MLQRSVIHAAGIALEAARLERDDELAEDELEILRSDFSGHESLFVRSRDWGGTHPPRRVSRSRSTYRYASPRSENGFPDLSPSPDHRLPLPDLVPDPDPRDRSRMIEASMRHIWLIYDRCFQGSRAA